MTSARFADVVTSDARRAQYHADGSWDHRTLAGQVSEHAEVRPDSVAVVDGRGRYTTAQLASDAAAFAAGLADRGVSAGSVVSLQLPNWYESVVAAVAVQSLGCVINPLLPNYRTRELANVFRAARPAAIVTPQRYREVDYEPLIRSVTADVDHQPVHVTVRASGGTTAAFDDVVRAGSGARLGTGLASAVSEVIFTSGTEAQPKAVMHTEQTAGFSVRVAWSDLGLADDDVVWMPSPVGHSTGFNYGVRFALHHGLRLVLQDRWDADDAADLINAEQCSYTLAATTFLQDLVSAARRRSVTLGSMRCFGCGGAPVPAELVDRAEAVGIQVLRLYGSTEVLVATWNRPGSPVELRRHTDGVPMSGVEVAVRRDDGAPAAPGEAGEAVVRGPNTCVGFHDDPVRTAATFDDDGWVRSGDVVTMDDDGALTVVGRKKEIIIRGGLNIAPREIEDLVGAFPEVERCAVIGVPDERLGEKMCACVVVHAGRAIDFDTLVARLREAGLASYKLPERLEVLSDLPVTASGKIQKHLLVEQLAARSDRD